MKRILVFLALASCAVAGTWMASPGKGSHAAAGGGFLVSEGAEGTGTPAGWTDSGSPDWDYTTTILEGTQSMSFANGGWGTSYAIAANSTVWAYVLVRPVITNDPYVVRLRDVSNNQLAAIRFLSDGRVRVYSDNSDFADSAAGTVTSGTTYSVWLEYVKGTGSNSIARAYVSTTTTKPSATASYTTGTETADCTKLEFAPGSADLMIWDHIRASSTSIGSAPL